MRPNAAARSSSVSRVGSLVVLAAFGWACGGRPSLQGAGDAASPDGGVPDGADAGLPDGAIPEGAEGFVERLAAAACDAVAQCCTSAGIAHDAKSCRLMMAARLYGAIPSATSPSVAYDPDVAEACVQTVVRTVGQCQGPSVYFGVTSEPLRSACVRALNGIKPTGALCDSWNECDQSAGQTWCELNADNERRCTLASTLAPPPAQPLKQIGETCFAATNPEGCATDCAPGTFCDTDGKCAAKRASGPCTDACNAACAGGTYCDGTSCQPSVPVGGACPTYDTCQHPGAFCWSGRCVPSLLDLCTGAR